MKTYFVILFSFLLFIFISLPTKLMAQLEKSEVISLAARINEPVEIDIDDTPVVFEFNSFNDFQKGLGGTGSTYTTNAKVLTSSKLNMKVIPLQPMIHEDGVTELPLDNIGFSTNLAQENQKKISTTHHLNESNLTSIESNSTVKNLDIYWEMGTKNLVSQNLQEQSLKSGTYSTEVMILFAEEI